MPSWLLSLLQIFAPLVIKWALALLEQKYPGIAAELKKILDYLNQHPNPIVAVRNIKDCTDGVCGVTPDVGKIKK